MYGKYRKSVFIVTYHKSENKIFYLILKRKLHWNGWEFPKGGIEEKENPFEAVQRELKEETGAVPLKIKKFNFRGKYKYKKLVLDREGIIGQSFSLYAAEIKKQKIKFDEKEHTDFRWLAFEEAMKILTHQNQKKSLKIVNNWLTRSERENL